MTIIRYASQNLIQHEAIRSANKVKCLPSCTCFISPLLQKHEQNYVKLFHPKIELILTKLSQDRMLTSTSRPDFKATATSTEKIFIASLVFLPQHSTPV